MNEVRVSNVNQALQEGFWHLKVSGIQEQSRNGPVCVAPDPLVTTYMRPTERVLFCPKRDANHTFHLMEAIWMLAGENNVEWLLQFNSKFDQYAEPDGSMHGAYGHRWRRHFGGDQIINVIDKLQADPHTRQAVIAMWSPEDDLVGDWKDRPCNTHIYFDMRNNMLNMTVCCRSNDALWGAYGSNVVHFSMLQELIASAVGCDVGVYRQFSNNFHAYTSVPLASEFINSPPTADSYDLYATGVAHTFPMLADGETYDQFLSDCATMVNGGHGFYTRFMHEVAHPMMQIYLSRKWGTSYQKHIESMAKCDWYHGLMIWISNREKN